MWELKYSVSHYLPVVDIEEMDSVCLTPVSNCNSNLSRTDTTHVKRRSRQVKVSDNFEMSIKQLHLIVIIVCNEDVSTR
ncbi:hypothetical protein DPMN_059907 [Dreissena polymorpha]|uniref:Uncharacterized protein n=1 Tax=Dreissena polymorpha TaxID=45954 RepID=A0A9D4C4S4_DREPO|nr:hypothetical protein DPMN_059907 [Dreissena polymorpha]